MFFIFEKGVIIIVDVFKLRFVYYGGNICFEFIVFKIVYDIFVKYDWVIIELKKVDVVMKKFKVDCVWKIFNDLLKVFFDLNDFVYYMV